MKILKALLFSILTLVSLTLSAHGEDKPGPHGGFIRMPGAFHTEVVKEIKGYRVYLLDLHWRNPSVLNSSVLASIQVGKKKTELTCVKDVNSYFCNSSLPQKGVLNIIAKREGQSGGVSSYRLPLQLETSGNDMPAHQDHQ